MDADRMRQTNRMNANRMNTTSGNIQWQQRWAMASEHHRLAG